MTFMTMSTVLCGHSTEPFGLPLRGVKAKTLTRLAVKAKTLTRRAG